MSKPRIYLRDQNDVVIEAFNPDQYFDSSIELFLKGKSAVVKFSILKTDLFYDLITVGKNISFKYEEEDYWLSCMIVEQDENFLTITAWPIGLEYTNELTGPYASPRAMTFAEYFKVVVFDNSIVIGNNEVGDKKLSYEWEGTDTKLGRLYSIAALFDAEIEFVTTLNDDGSLKELKVNVYKEHSDTEQGIGNDRRGETFFFGKDIKEIRKIENKENLYTAIRCRGKDGLTISSINREVKDADGNVEYYTKSGDWTLYAPLAAGRFPANTHVSDKWTMYMADDTEYTSAEALYGYMLALLKTLSVPETTWEIEGYIEARIGDTVRIIDDGYTPALILEARVVEQLLDWDNPQNSKTTFSNVNVLKSKISDSLTARMNDLFEANKVYAGFIETTNGVQFKNNTGSTQLTAVVKDGVVLSTGKFTIHWYKDGVEISQNTSIMVDATEVDNKSVYHFEATDENDKIRSRAEVTITDVNDGINGQPGKDGLPTYVHTAWKMPDGRFTKIYPNNNIMPNSAVPNFAGYASASVIKTLNVTVPEWNTSEAVQYDITWGTQVSGVAALWTSGRTTGAGYRSNWSFGLDVKNIGTTVLKVGTNIAGSTLVQPGESIRINKSVLNYMHANGAALQFSIDRPTPGTAGEAHFICWRGKIEEGPEQTIWTPRPQDDYENAYPKWVGNYSDNSENSSDVADDYKPWQVIRGEDGMDGTNGTDGINGDGQLLFNNKFENYETGTYGSMGWTKSVIASVLAAESDFPTYRIMRLRYTAQSFIYSRNVPIVAGNTVLLKFQARTSDLATLTDRLAHISLLDKNAGETTSSSTKYVWLRRNGTYINPGVTNVVVTGALTEVNKWTDFTVQFTVPDDIVNMKFAIFSETNVDTDFRIPTVVSWKKGEDGSNGIGVTGSSVAYAISLSGILPPTTGWQSTIPETPAGSFLWTRVIVNYSDNTSTTSYSVGKMGVNGSDGKPTGMVSQATVPDNPYEGMLWEDTSTTPPVVKIYKDGAWQIWYLHVNNLDVDNLSAISSNMGDLTAGTITGAEIYGSKVQNSFDYPEDVQEVNWVRGTYTIENGETVLEWERYQKATGTIIERGEDTLRPGQVTGETYKLTDGSRDKYYSLAASGLYMTNNNQNINLNVNQLSMNDGLLDGSLTAWDLYDTGWVDVTNTGAVTSGKVYLRRHFGRLILRLDWINFNGNGNLCRVPSYMNTMVMNAMYRAQQWSANNAAGETFIVQTNSSTGDVAKISATTGNIRAFIELF